MTGPLSDDIECLERAAERAVAIDNSIERSISDLDPRIATIHRSYKELYGLESPNAFSPVGVVKGVHIALTGIKVGILVGIQSVRLRWHQEALSILADTDKVSPRTPEFILDACADFRNEFSKAE